MATTNLGKVSVTPKGAWNSSNAYEKLDIVTNGGNGYIALKDVPSGTAITNTSYWLKFADKGDKGDTGEINGASASISGGYGSPSVSVTEGGTSTDRSFAFAFSNLKGNGIESIALQGTSGAEKTYRITFSDGSHFDYVVTDGEVTEESLEETLEGYLPMDGYSESAGVGTADNLTTNTGLDDETPFSFRTTGGSVDVGDRKEVHALVGYDIAWNQLASLNPSDWQTDYASVSISGQKIVTTPDTDSSSMGKGSYVDIVPNHKILVLGKYLGTTSTKNGVYGLYSSVNENIYASRQILPQGTDARIDTIFSGTADSMYFAFYLGVAARTSDHTDYEDVIVTDLTLCFGTQIADYVYSLETAQSGSGVQWLKDHGFFTKPYYAYQAGKLEPVETGESVTIGFNLYDPSTGKATLVGGKQHQITGTYTALSYSTGETITPDADGHFTPSASGELTVTGGNATDTCVHLVWDESRDGEWEQFIKRTYLFGHSILHGILKIDGNGNLYADGDVRRPDGTKTSKWAFYTIDGTENWVQGSSDVHLFYWTTNPETLPYKNNGVMQVYDKYSFKGFASSGYSAKIGAGDGWCAYGGSGTQTNVKEIAFKDASISTLDDWKAKLVANPIIIAYEVIAPTTEQVETYTETQIVSDFGTEYLTDYAYENGTRDVEIPVGHNTFYPYDLKAKLEMAPNSPDGSGDYIVRQTNGTNEYVAIGDNATIQSLLARVPQVPTEDGSYVLRTVVTGGVAVTQWVAE